jgi:hypothetical protein
MLCAGVGETGAGSTTRGVLWVPSSLSATGSSCFEMICSLPAVATRSWMALPGSPAVAGTILVGVELSAVITGGGSEAVGLLT